MSSIAILQNSGTVEVLECEQGTAEWHQARAGVITSSMFGEILKVTGGLDAKQQAYVDAILKDGRTEDEARDVAGYKAKPKTDKIARALDGERVGERTAAADDYAFRLAVERISGEALRGDEFETYDMRRGHELEPDARALHAMSLDLEIQRCGFVRTKDGKFGTSTDGLIVGQPPGGSEYKCFTQASKLKAILLNGDIEEHLPQCQGGLWLTGFSFWHFALYCPTLATIGRDLTVFPMQRDEAYIENMERELLGFDRLVEDYRARLESGQAPGQFGERLEALKASGDDGQNDNGAMGAFEA